jgi:hypothetical protein
MAIRALEVICTDQAVGSLNHDGIFRLTPRGTHLQQLANEVLNLGDGCMLRLKG